MSEQKLNPEVFERAKKIKFLLMDCDGVLTDGRLYYSETGEVLKVFHVRDGQGLVNWHAEGFTSGIITGRTSKILETRAAELGIAHLRQGATDKALHFKELKRVTGFERKEIAYIGDDIVDLALFDQVGLAVAVQDAVSEVKEKANVITDLNGGNGAVRELIDLLLNIKQR